MGAARKRGTREQRVKWATEKQNKQQAALNERIQQYEASLTEEEKQQRAQRRHTARVIVALAATSNSDMRFIK